MFLVLFSLPSLWLLHFRKLGLLWWSIGTLRFSYKSKYVRWNAWQALNMNFQVKGDINKWKHMPCLWIGRLKIKMLVLPKWSTDLVQSLSEFQCLFCRNRKTHPKIYRESQGTPNSQSSLKKEQQNWQTHTFLILKFITTKLQ